MRVQFTIYGVTAEELDVHARARLAAFAPLWHKTSRFYSITATEHVTRADGAVTVWRGDVEAEFGLPVARDKS